MQENGFSADQLEQNILYNAYASVGDVEKIIPFLTEKNAILFSTFVKALNKSDRHLEIETWLEKFPGLCSAMNVQKAVFGMLFERFWSWPQLSKKLQNHPKHSRPNFRSQRIANKRGGGGVTPVGVFDILYMYISAAPWL